MLPGSKTKILYDPVTCRQTKACFRVVSDENATPYRLQLLSLKAIPSSQITPMRSFFYPHMSNWDMIFLVNSFPEAGIYTNIYLDLPKGAKWLLKGVN